MAVLEYSSLPKERSPLGELLALALPTVAQMASYTLMQFIDTWMLAHLGKDYPTAASNAGMFSFSFISFGMGLLMIVNALASQEYGARQFKLCGRFLWQGVWVALLYSLLLVPILFTARFWFVQFNHGPGLIPLETAYFQIMLAGTVLKLCQTSFSQFLLATNRAQSVMVSSMLGVAVNIVAAYMLVWGRLGFSGHGIVGAGLAQNIGVSVELLCLVIVSFWGSGRSYFGATDWTLRWQEMKKLVEIGFGSGVQFVVDVLAWTLFMNVVIGHFGENAMAANAFMFRYLVLSFLPAVGVSQAVTALVGRYIGMKKPDEAAHRAHLGFFVVTAYMLFCAVVYVVFRRQLIGLFTTDPEVIRIGAILMIFAAFYQFFDAMYIVYNGALRGAGDTFIPAVVTAGLCWSLTVGGGWLIARYWFSFGPTGPWLSATVYGILLGVFMLIRFKKGGWKRIELVEAA